MPRLILSLARLTLDHGLSLYLSKWNVVKGRKCAVAFRLLELLGFEVVTQFGRYKMPQTAVIFNVATTSCKPGHNAAPLQVLPGCGALVQNGKIWLYHYQAVLD
jgi:hypothetical protein